MRVSDQPNLPLITAASQKGQMLVRSTFTGAPQLGQASAVMFPRCALTALAGRWKIQSSVQSHGAASPAMPRPLLTSMS